MDDLQELESNPIFLCMNLKPGQELEFPINIQGTAPYRFRIHRQDESEFVDIRPTTMFHQQIRTWNGLQKHYWHEAMRVSDVFPGYKLAFVSASLIACLNIVGVDFDTARRSVSCLVVEYTQALAQGGHDA